MTLHKISTTMNELFLWLFKLIKFLHLLIVYRRSCNGTNCRERSEGFDDDPGRKPSQAVLSAVSLTSEEGDIDPCSVFLIRHHQCGTRSHRLRDISVWRNWTGKKRVCGEEEVAAGKLGKLLKLLTTAAALVLICLIHQFFHLNEQWKTTHMSRQLFSCKRNNKIISALVSRFFFSSNRWQFSHDFCF